MGYLTPGQDFTDFRTFLIFEISFLSGSCRLCLKIDFTISIRQNLKNMCAAAICTHTHTERFDLFPLQTCNDAEKKEKSSL